MALAITHLIESVRAVLFVNRNAVRLCELYHRHLFISIPILTGIAFSSIYLNSRYFFVHFAMPAYCFVRLIKRQPFCIIFEAKNVTSSVDIRFLSHFNSSTAIAYFLYFLEQFLFANVVAFVCSRLFVHLSLYSQGFQRFGLHAPRLRFTCCSLSAA